MDNLTTTVNWAPPIFKGDIWTYPETVKSDEFGTIRPFADGDRILFIGDSITHGNYGGHTYVQLMTYFATRYPNIYLTSINKGIDGNTAQLVNARFGFDIGNPIDVEANVAVVLIGTNDMSRTEYIAGRELEKGAEERRIRLLKNYERNLRQLLSNIRQYTAVQRIILLSPPIFDEWMPVANKPASEGFNNVIRKAGQICKKIAQESENVEFVDIHTPQILTSQYRRRYYYDGFTVANDRVHPNAETHYVGVNSILKSMGESGLVASVAVHADSKTAIADNAQIEDLRIEDDLISYRYLPFALPLPCEQTYRKAQRLFPITEELNRETIRVQGLKNGNYALEIDGSVLTVVSAKQLDTGVNISEYENNPGQKQALYLFAIMDEGRKRDAVYRDFVKREAILQRKYNLSFNDFDTFVKAIADAESRMTAEDAKEAEELISLKRNEGQWVKDNREFEDQIFKLNKPACHFIRIFKTDLLLRESHTVRYERFLLPAGTTNLSEISRGLECIEAKVLFRNEEITNLPSEGGEIRVALKLRNTSVRTIPAQIQILAAKGTEISGFTESLSIHLGKTEELLIPIMLKPNTDSLSVEIISDSVKVLRGVFPIASANIDRIEVGCNALPPVLSGSNFTVFGLHRFDTEIPTVRAYSDNIFCRISVLQPNQIGDCAEIQSVDRSYRVSIVNRVVPYAAKISVGGKDLEDFNKEIYAYEVKSAPQKVECIYGEFCKCSVWQATKEKLVAVVKVRSIFGDEREYRIHFT